MVPQHLHKEIVSVIIPTYNREATIGAAIQSVLWQVGSEIELIVVDDGSRDGTRGVVEGFSDPRVKLISLDENRGANHARNIGWRHARGKWVAFQDSDDIWHPDKLAVQMEAISRRPSAAGCFSAFVRCGLGYAARVPSFDIHEGDGLADQILHENFVSTQTLVVSRDALEEAGGFDETLPRFQDWDLAIRLLQRRPLCYVPQPLVTVIDSDDSISHDPQKLVDAFRYVHCKYASLYSEHPQASASVHLHIARGHSRLGEYQRALLEAGRAVGKHRGSLVALPSVLRHMVLSVLKQSATLRR